MCDKSIKDLVDHYIHVSFSVNKIAEGLIKGEIGSDLTNDQHYTLRYINKVRTCTSSELAEVRCQKKCNHSDYYPAVGKRADSKDTG